MIFFERVKKLLLERNMSELATIDSQIKDIEKKLAEESDNVQRLKDESDKARKEKTKFQKELRTKEELADLEIIYNFIVNMPRIRMMIEKMIEAEVAYNKGYVLSFEREEDYEFNRRYELYEIIKKLNGQITEIMNAEIEDDPVAPKEETVVLPAPVDENKKGFLARLFGKSKENTQPIKPQKLSRNDFHQYIRLIEDFRKNYNSFIMVELEDFEVVTKLTCAQILNGIHQLLAAKRKGFELYEEDEIYLSSMQPHELWKEISKYYSNISLIVNIIDDFDKNVHKFMQMYRTNPELFDVKNLEEIFEENDQMILALKLKNKDALSKKSEMARKKQRERESQSKLKTLEEKRKSVEDKIRKIEKAKTLKELGFKDKADAAKKLSIDMKDYILIPIHHDIKDISDLFNEEKEIEVQVDGDTFSVTYSNEVATGKINSLEAAKGVKGVLMVPISSLKKENIDTVRAGRISLNKSALNVGKIVAIIPAGKNMNFEDLSIDVREYSFGTLDEQLRRFLGDDYIYGTEDTENYTIFKGMNSISAAEKRTRKEAVKRCLIENVKRDIEYTDTIFVNGKLFFLDKNDILDMKENARREPVNETFLGQIVEEIENFLIEDNMPVAMIDIFYKKLSKEYMRVYKKAKADYYNEDDSTIVLSGRKISIKPRLPGKDESIIKKYTRPREDVAYKLMKLANLTNLFAHLTESEELQNMLFDIKLDLIERVMDLAKDNPNIKIKKVFDASKMTTGVVLEVPGYNMIALHIMKKNISLANKANQLDEIKVDVLQTSPILVPGVNKDVWRRMKDMSEEERLKVFADMDINTFYKLVIRMGYSTDSVLTEEDRKKFIRGMVSDKKIAELLKESDDLEK